MITGNKGKYLVLWLIATSGILLSFALCYRSVQHERAKIRSAFDEVARYRFNIIKDALEESVSSLRSFGDFYAASHTVDRDEFDTFSKGIFSRLPYIFEFRWLKRVPLEKRQEFEESGRSQLGPDFQISDLGENSQFIRAAGRPEYFPIFYNSVSEWHRLKHEPVIGLDAAGFPERWQAMQVARDTADIAAIGLTKCYGEDEINNIMRIFLPIYRNGLNHNNLTERRNNLQGLVVMLFQAEKLFSQCLEDIPPAGVDITFFELSGGKKELLYFHSSRTRSQPIEFSQLKNTSAISYSKSFKMADQEWLLVCTPSPDFLSRHKVFMPGIILFIGLAFTLLLTLYLRAILYGKEQVEDLVSQRTEELRETNELNEMILKTVPFPMDIVDENGNILYISERFKSFGRAELTSNKCWEILRDNKKQCPGCPLHSGIKIGETATIECEGVSGGKVFLITHAGVIFQGKKAVLELFYDITDYRKAEVNVRKLSLAVEQGPAMVIITDNEGNIEYVNQKFNDLTGFVFEEVKGKNPRLLKSGEQPEAFYKGLWEMIKSGGVWRGQFHNRKKNGELYWANTLISPLRNEKGGIANFIAIEEDVTVLKRTEDELKQAKENLEIKAQDLARVNEELKKLDQLKSDFVSTVSHELRTPLSIMKESITQVYEGTHGEISSKQKHFLSMSLSGINRITRIVEGLLDISRIESGKLQLNKGMVDLSELAGSIAASFKAALQKKGLKLKEEFPVGKVEVFADRDKLTQVLINLLSNATKFTEQGDITIKIEEKDGGVECSVADTGVGISEDNLPKLFSKFEQFNKELSLNSGGIGLGLNISKSIVELHGGRIWAESKLGEGTKIIFSLPKNYR